MTIEDRYWPFVLLAPSDTNKRVYFLQTLFSSPIVVEVLTLFNDRNELCQKEVVSILKHHSNKTVISILRKLVGLGLLIELSKLVHSGNRVVKKKCYKLTEVGKWYNIFLRNIEVLDRDTLIRILNELLSIFIGKLATLKEKLNISYTEFMNIFTQQLMYSLVRRGSPVAPKVTVFGSMALDIYIDKDLKIFSGGSGANVAVNCARLGLPTAFVTRIPGDALGLKLALELVDEGIDISYSQLDPKARTTVCIVRKWYTENPDIICDYDENIPPVVTELSNDVLSLCNNVKAIYLGEGVCRIFRELLEGISKEDKIVIYRPSIWSLENYFEECRDVLRHSQILILNEIKCEILRRKGVNIPTDLFKLDVKNIIITKGSKGVVIYTPYETISIPAQIQKNIDLADNVGAGDLFAATLIYHLLQGLDLVEATKESVIKVSQNISVLGPRKLSKISHT